MDKTEQCCEGHPGWEYVSCGCAGGLKYDCEYPTVCGACDGTGQMMRHKESGALALYPGGPFLGRDCNA